MWIYVIDFLIFTLYITSVNSYQCELTTKICETSLNIEHYLTMTHPVNATVYPYQGKLYDYRVTDPTSATPLPVEEVISADGWETKRLVVVANRTLPGPDIIVYEGQTVVIHVKNSLASDSVSIHWHGLHQAGSPFMDGVPFISQCPIAAGQTFTYRFTAYPPGTFWYHSHVGSQRAKGLFGAFIILKNESTALPEHILQIQEWNHDWDADYGFEMMVYGIVENRKPFTPSETVDGSFFSLLKAHSGLFNGRGRYYYNYGNGTHNEAPLEVFNVKKGSSYRFRVIAVGALYPFRISVDDHVITVIESDGYPVQPVTVESFIISPGERFDFTLIANQSIGNYWIRGRTLETNRVTLAEAILRYDDAPANDPTTKRKECKVDDKCTVLNCPFQLFPEKDNTDCILFDQLKSRAVNDPAPQVINGRFKEYFLNFVSEGMVNGKTFKFPSVAGIAQPKEITSQCDETKCENKRMCMCTYSINLNKGDTVQIVLSNVGVDAGMSHPIHMHGHSFYVLKTGLGKHNETTGQFLSQNEDIACKGSLPREQNDCNEVRWTNNTWLNGNVPGLELQNPPRKDTINIPNGGYVVIRIKADNPGLWFLHCHIEFHATHGMGLVLNESFPNVPRVPPGFPTCRDFRRESSEGFEEEFEIFTTEANKATGTIPLFVFWIVVGVLSGIIIILLLAVFLVRRSVRKKGEFTAVATS